MRRRRTTYFTVVAAIGLTGAMLWPTAAYAAPRCFGKAATIVGTSHRERLTGTSGRDVIVGRGGGDRLDGRGGNDLLCGGGGGDLLIGGNGRDRLDGGGGGDALKPDAGNDFIDGGKSLFDDVRYPDAPGPIEASLVTGIATGEGNDTFENVEQLVGGAFDDVLEGDDGPTNVLIGLAGNDALTGNGGDDVLAGGDGDDALDGGDGFDFADNYFRNAFMPSEPLAGPMTVNLTTGTSTGNGTDTLVDIDAASGSLGDDVMTGNAGDNAFVVLNEGTDTVDAGPGDDLVDGGDGTDHLEGGPGTDQLGNLDATAGMTVNLSVPSDSHGDTLSGFEDLIGTFFDDVLTGTEGPNRIEGADGDDELSGLGGDDTLIGDFFDFSDGGADSADGGVGTDACDAETETNCETAPSPPPMPSLARQAVAMKMS
jgi:Ca2+-binding RTX toxin-like protein